MVVNILNIYNIVSWALLTGKRWSRILPKRGRHISKDVPENDTGNEWYQDRHKCKFPFYERDILERRRTMTASCCRIHIALYSW